VAASVHDQREWRSTRQCVVLQACGGCSLRSRPLPIDVLPIDVCAHDAHRLRVHRHVDMCMHTYTSMHMHMHMHMHMGMHMHMDMDIGMGMDLSMSTWTCAVLSSDDGTADVAQIRFGVRQEAASVSRRGALSGGERVYE